MAKTVGLGTLAFAGLTSKFKADSGFDLGGAEVPAVDITDDSMAQDAYKGGNVKNYGQVTGEIMIDATKIEETDTLVGTSATLTYTAVLSATGSPATIVGSCVFLSAKIKAVKNGVLTASVVLQRTGAQTYTDEAP